MCQLNSSCSVLSGTRQEHKGNLGRSCDLTSVTDSNRVEPDRLGNCSTIVQSIGYTQQSDDRGTCSLVQWTRIASYHIDESSGLWSSARWRTGQRCVAAGYWLVGILAECCGRAGGG